MAGVEATTLQVATVRAVLPVLNQRAIPVVGTVQASSGVPPCLGINYLICVQGVFPARN